MKASHLGLYVVVSQVVVSVYDALVKICSRRVAAEQLTELFTPLIQQEGEATSWPRRRRPGILFLATRYARRAGKTLRQAFEARPLEEEASAWLSQREHNPDDAILLGYVSRGSGGKKLKEGKDKKRKSSFPLPSTSS
jgi:hypothetical protein